MGSSYVKIRAGSYPFTLHTATGSLTSLSMQDIVLGANYNNSAFFDGTIRFALCAQSEISDEDCDKIVTWAQNRHSGHQRWRLQILRCWS